MRRASEDSDALVAAVTGSGDRVGRSRDPFGDQGRHRKAFEAATELLGGGVAEVAHLDEGLGSCLAGRALGDDKDPDRLDCAVPGLRAAARSTAEGGPGGFDGVEGIGLAAATALLSIGSVDLDDLDAPSSQVASQAGPIRARALDADLGHVPEGLEPGQQRLVAGGVGLEALRAEQPPERVERGSHMDVEVGVDTTSHTTRGFYDGHWSSLLLMELGMARPFRIGATGGPGLLLQAGPLTLTRRRDVPLSMCGWKVSVDDILRRHGTPSQAEPTSTPEAISDQQSSGGP